jgi:Lon protease-like protein
MDATEIPLFPLNTVLFPGGPLPLRVFEPRYLDMVSRCLREEQEFGVLLIREGVEIGPVETFNVGTLAEIVDWYQGSDGLLGVTAEGRKRFRLKAAERQSDGLYIGTIEILESETSAHVPEEYEFLSRLLREVLDELGNHYQRIPKAYDDASWVGYRLSEILPLPLATKQEFLEMTDPELRLSLLRPHVREVET